MDPGRIRLVLTGGRPGLAAVSAIFRGGNLELPPFLLPVPGTSVKLRRDMFSTQLRSRSKMDISAPPAARFLLEDFMEAAVSAGKGGAVSPDVEEVVPAGVEEVLEGTAEKTYSTHAFLP